MRETAVKRMSFFLEILMLYEVYRKGGIILVYTAHFIAKVQNERFFTSLT